VRGVVLAASLLAASLAGCGSTASMSFVVVLRGAPIGYYKLDARGSASATIDVAKGAREVCWRFSRLAGVPDPAVATIDIGEPDAYGSVEVALGSRFSAGGCTTHVARSRLAAIVHDPGGYYVAIATRAYPVVAVRSQLAPA